MNRLSVALVLAALPAPAIAADFSFTRTDNAGGDRPFSFTIATTPTPDGSTPTSFDIFDVPTHEVGEFGQSLDYAQDYSFYSSADFGGFENGLVAYFGEQLFGGSTTAPVFYNGVYNLTDFGGGEVIATLTITNGATLPGGVPEPASWALMLSGFAAAGTALRRRPRVIAA